MPAPPSLFEHFRAPGRVYHRSREVSMWWFLASACSNGTIAPPGDPTRFDPFGSLDAVAEFAGPGARVVSISMSNVRADGTIDLTQLVGSTGEYTFLREVPAPANPPPLGAGGSLDGRYYQQVDVTIYKPGAWRQVMSGRSRYNYRHQGMERDEGALLPGALPADIPPRPTCRVADLWKKIPGIPSGAVARVDWEADWKIGVLGTEFSGEFDASCRNPDAVPAPRPERPDRARGPGKAKARPRR